MAGGAGGLFGEEDRLAAEGVFGEFPGGRDVRREFGLERIRIDREGVEVGGFAGGLHVEFDFVIALLPASPSFFNCSNAFCSG